MPLQVNRCSAILLFFNGLAMSSSMPVYMSYPMGLTTRKTFPTAMGMVSTAGSLGGFFSPMIAGYLLDVFKSFSVGLLFLRFCHGHDLRLRTHHGGAPRIHRRREGVKIDKVRMMVPEEGQGLEQRPAPLPFFIKYSSTAEWQRHPGSTHPVNL